MDTFQVEQHNNQVRKALRERLLAMTAGVFEELILQSLAEKGFEMVEVCSMNHANLIFINKSV